MVNVGDGVFECGQQPRGRTRTNEAAVADEASLFEELKDGCDWSTQC